MWTCLGLMVGSLSPDVDMFGAYGSVGSLGPDVDIYLVPWSQCYPQGVLHLHITGLL